MYHPKGTWMEPTGRTGHSSLEFARAWHAAAIMHPSNALKPCLRLQFSVSATNIDQLMFNKQQQLLVHLHDDVYLSIQ